MKFQSLVRERTQGLLSSRSVRKSSRWACGLEYAIVVEYRGVEVDWEMMKMSAFGM